MAGNSYFQFKQFRVLQERAAMRVGIDGVLLGAWASLDHADRVLDVGTGTGLLALMAAQRSKAQINALEIDADAAEDARHNFSQSPWGDRISLDVVSFQNYVSPFRFDHIISNPPFFDTTVKSPKASRAQARHADALPLAELVGKSAQLLTGSGKLSLVLPHSSLKSLEHCAHTAGLYINRLLELYPNPQKAPHRIFAELSPLEQLRETERLAIREAGEQDYSAAYKALTRDFYLAF